MVALSKTFFKNQKCLAKYLNEILLVQRISIKKSNFRIEFDDNLSVAHVFIKQIFRAAEETPPSPPPHAPSTSLGKI
jgi:hypothetical protein